MEDSPHGSTASWAENLFRANGWHTINLRWGSRIETVFAKPGGATFRRRLESFSDSHYQSLLLHDGATIRSALLGSRQHDDKVIAQFLEAFAGSVAPLPDASSLNILNGFSDADLKTLIEDLGGHDIEKLIQAHQYALRFKDGPTAILCHTVKGRGLPGWAGHPENHGVVLSADRMTSYRRALSLPDGEAFDLPAADSGLAAFLMDRSDELFPPETEKTVAYPVELMPAWEEIRTPLEGTKSTGTVFGSLNLTYLKSRIGKHMAFVAPDVGLTTHLGGVINATGVFDAAPGPDLMRFLREKQQQPFGWRLSREGQFHSIAINEGLAAMLAFAFGRDKYAIRARSVAFQSSPSTTCSGSMRTHRFTTHFTITRVSSQSVRRAERV